MASHKLEEQLSVTTDANGGFYKLKEGLQNIFIGNRKSKDFPNNFLMRFLYGLPLFLGGAYANSNGSSGFGNGLEITGVAIMAAYGLAGMHLIRKEEKEEDLKRAWESVKREQENRLRNLERVERQAREQLYYYDDRTKELAYPQPLAHAEMAENHQNYEKRYFAEHYKH